MLNKYFPLKLLKLSSYASLVIYWIFFSSPSFYKLNYLEKDEVIKQERDCCSFLWKFNQFSTSFSKRLLISTRSKSKSSKFQLLKNHDGRNVLLFIAWGLISKKFQKVMGIISQQVPDFKAFKRLTPYKCSSSSEFLISKQSVSI